MTTQYRSDVDGLRGIAIIFVVLFHAFPKFVPGGFIGVDVFFVISGYLISAIIMREIEQGDFRFSDFFVRRINRIFPALILVLIAAMIAGSQMLTAIEFRRLAKHVIGGATFTSNFITMSESSYFDATAESNPLLHLWSLAIEEQFYIFWPILLFSVVKLRQNPRTICLIIMVISFLLCLRETNISLVSSFFLPHMRVWEILMGGCLAFRAHQNQDKPSQMNLASACGITLIVASAFIFDKKTPYPSFWALMPTTGACLMLVSGGSSVVNGFFLSNRILVYVGLISYPLYLWHWPLLTLARNALGNLPTKVTFFIVMVSLFLAAATFELLERPLRGFSKTKNGVVLFFCLLIVGLMGFSIFKSDGKTRQTVKATYVDETEIKAEHDRYWTAMEYRFNTGRRRAIIFGDSQGYDVFSALMWDTKLGIRMFQSESFCSGFNALDTDAPKDKGKICSSRFNALITSSELKQADVLIYTHYWESIRENRESYKEGVDAIQRINPNIKIYFLGPKPLLGNDYVDMNVILKSRKANEDINEFLNRRKNIRVEETKFVKDLAAELNVGFIDINPIFCSQTCPFFTGDKFSYIEHNHWTANGARLFFYKFYATKQYQKIFHSPK